MYVCMSKFIQNIWFPNSLSTSPLLPYPLVSSSWKPSTLLLSSELPFQNNQILSMETSIPTIRCSFILRFFLGDSALSFNYYTL